MAAPQQPPQPQPAQLTLLQAQVGPPSGSAAAAVGGHPGSAQAAAGAASLTVAQAPGGLQPPAQAQDFDPVQRFRLLLPQLKESLQSLMKVAAQNFIQNTNIDSGQKSNDGPVQRVDKSLEEFYALCDQLELCLQGICPPSPSQFVLAVLPERPPLAGLCGSAARLRKTHTESRCPLRRGSWRLFARGRPSGGRRVMPAFLPRHRDSAVCLLQKPPAHICSPAAE